MTKLELVNSIEYKSSLAKGQGESALHAFMESVTESLAKGEEVSLPGFGTFSVSHREARMGRNPATGAALQIAATNVPNFKAGKNLKAAMN